MIDTSAHDTPPQDDEKPGEAASPAAPAKAGAARPGAAGARKADPRAAERLAAALRENLRRRKQQAKARRSDAGSTGGQGQD